MPLPGPPTTLAPHRWRAGVLILLAALAYHAPAFGARVTHDDNLLVMEWASGARWPAALAGDPRFANQWRPVAFLLARAEYALFGLAPLWPHMLLNVLLWAAALYTAVRMAARLGVGAAAWVAWALIATDYTALIVTSFIMGHHLALDVLASLALWAAALRATDRPPLGHAGQAGLLALVLVAGMVKELCLGAAIGVGLWGLYRRRRDLWLPALLGAGLYVVLRLAATTPTPHCVEAGYFFTTREVCMVPVSGITVSQALYNTAVALVASVAPGLIGVGGRIIIYWDQVPLWCAVLGLAALGLRRLPHPGLALLIVAGSALLSAPVFEEHNVIVGRVVIAVAAAAGIPAAWAASRHRVWTRVAITLGILVCTASLTMRATRTFESILTAARTDRDTDPCTERRAGDWVVDRGFVRRVKLANGLPNPDCAGVPEPSAAP